MSDKIREQIQAIRDTGLTSMLDIPMVQRLAYEREFYELVCWIEDHKRAYWHFIMTGEVNEDDN